jgi:hypothetical protein
MQRPRNSSGTSTLATLDPLFRLGLMLFSFAMVGLGVCVDLLSFITLGLRVTNHENIILDGKQASGKAIESRLHAEVRLAD